MSYAATVYRVLVASPSDIETERSAIRDLVYQWNNVHKARTRTHEALLEASDSALDAVTVQDAPGVFEHCGYHAMMSDTVNSAANAAEASEALGELEAAPPGSMAGYSRELFPHWSNVEEFG